MTRDERTTGSIYYSYDAETGVWAAGDSAGRLEHEYEGRRLVDAVFDVMIALEEAGLVKPFTPNPSP